MHVIGEAVIIHGARCNAISDTEPWHLKNQSQKNASIWASEHGWLTSLNYIIKKSNQTWQILKTFLGVSVSHP